jgi:transcriptional regulator with AAA-type ATPase domain
MKQVTGVVRLLLSDSKFTQSVKIPVLRFRKNDDILYLDVVYISNFAERY